MSFLDFSISSVLGYQLVKFLTHPESRIYKKLPKIKIKWFQFSPNIRIHIKGKVVSLHHWMSLSVILIISIFVDGGILASNLTRGFLLGGTLQGFTFPDWKQIIFTIKEK